MKLPLGLWLPHLPRSRADQHIHVLAPSPLPLSYLPLYVLFILHPLQPISPSFPCLCCRNFAAPSFRAATGLPHASFFVSSIVRNEPLFPMLPTPPSCSYFLALPSISRATQKNLSLCHPFCFPFCRLG